MLLSITYWSYSYLHSGMSFLSLLLALGIARRNSAPMRTDTCAETCAHTGEQAPTSPQRAANTKREKLTDKSVFFKTLPRWWRWDKKYRSSSPAPGAGAETRWGARGNADSYSLIENFTSVHRHKKVLHSDWIGLNLFCVMSLRIWGNLFCQV